MNLKDDSRKIKNGDTFIAIGSGHSFINEAIRNGATKIICEDKTYGVETLIVEDTRKYAADYLKEKFKSNFDDTILIGITGTNGKTTSAFFTYQLFNMLDIPCAYIGTIGFYLNNRCQTLNNTTPDIIDLYEMFEECFNNNIKIIVMEVSSHALKLNRVLGIEYDYGVFTNLTHDHMDFHHNIDEYKKVKQQLFLRLKNNKYAIINSDDKYYQDFIFNNNNITYGINGDYKIKDYELFIDRCVFNVEFANKVYNINLNIPGKYNIYNYLCALIICHKYGFSIERIINESKNLIAPPGRMDIVKNNKKFVIIDYAHTPDAVLNILNSVKEYKQRRIITIIGCGGNRDKLKRPIMGEIATTNSDYVIFTNDNPRMENEVNIINDIIYNLTDSNYEIIYNREEAIKKGISLLEENDILLILGKGHENYQIIKNERLYFNDKEVATNYLNKTG